MKVKNNISDKNDIAQKRLELAKKYLENGKDTLTKAGIDAETNRYNNLKYISMASGTGYSGALEALKALLIVKNLIDEKDIKSKLKDYSIYTSRIKQLTMIGKDRDIILRLYIDIYDILHIGGYYRELQDKKSIDSGFEKVEKIINVVEKYIKHNGGLEKNDGKK
jgi:hypothetical protein